MENYVRLITLRRRIALVNVAVVLLVGVLSTRWTHIVFGSAAFFF